MSAEREPAHVIRDLGRKAADDAGRSAMNVAFLFDHPQDRAAIMREALCALFGMAMAAEAIAKGDMRLAEEVPLEEFRAYAFAVVENVVAGRALLLVAQRR